MPTIRSCLRLAKKVIILTAAILLLSNENAVKALLSLLVTLHVAVRVTLDLIQMAISHHGPAFLHTAVQDLSHYSGLAME
jgi:hypothetical protein